MGIRRTTPRWGLRAMWLLTGSCLACGLVVCRVDPLSAADSARAILDRRKALDDGERFWTDRHQRMHMRISGSSGTRERQLDVYERRYPNDEHKAVVFLREPADVRDVAFMGISRKGRAADQWLYVPALKRVRQIAASMRSDAFVTSDLSFEDLDLLTDMMSWSESDAVSSLRGDDTIDNVACHAIELRPQRDDIGYRRIVVWLGREDLVPRQIDFYAQAGSSGWFGLGGSAADDKPTKRVRQSNVSFDGKIPVARRIEVATLAKGSRSDIDIEVVEHNQHLPDALFTQRALETGSDAARAGQ